MVPYDNCLSRLRRSCYRFDIFPMVELRLETDNKEDLKSKSSNVFQRKMNLTEIATAYPGKLKETRRMFQNY